MSIFGLQIAHSAGAKTIVTSSSDQKLELAKKLGATHTINYKNTPNWEEEAMKLTNGVGVDHILEVGGPGTFLKSLSCIRRGGVISGIGFVAQGDEGAQNIPAMIITRQPNLRGIFVGSRQQLQDMVRAFEQNKIKPLVDKVFSFEQAKEAYEYLKSQQHVGKVVIKIAE